MTNISLTGTVSEVHPQMCRVIADDTLQSFLCTYRRAQVISRTSEIRERSPVAPGDRVEFEVTSINSKDGVIQKLLPRKNSLQRRAPGKVGEVLHTIAANIETLGIVVSIRTPEFNPGLLDRFLVAAIAEKIEPIIFLTKIDLNEAPFSPSEGPWKTYFDLGFRIFPLNIPAGIGIAEARAAVTNKVTVFCGLSGVGKTSLLQAFFGSSVGAISAISGSTGKGKHTTSTSRMIALPDGTRWIDTPGVREFAVVDINPDMLIECFPELSNAPADTRESLPRYQSYLRIKRSIENPGF